MSHKNHQFAVSCVAWLIWFRLSYIINCCIIVLYFWLNKINRTIAPSLGSTESCCQRWLIICIFTKLTIEFHTKVKPDNDLQESVFALFPVYELWPKVKGFLSISACSIYQKSFKFAWAFYHQGDLFHCFSSSLYVFSSLLRGLLCCNPLSAPC